MMNIILSLTIATVICITGCRNMESDPVVPGTDFTGSNQYVLRINGALVDTVTADCNSAYTSLHIAWIDDEHSFIFRQGPENIHINDSVRLSCYIILFDSTTSYPVYTPEIFAHYINHQQELVSIDLELKIRDRVYRNQWYNDWEIADYLERNITDQDATYTITTHEGIEPQCTEAWPLLPLTIAYNGRLSTEDGMSSIEFEALALKMHLAEAF